MNIVIEEITKIRVGNSEQARRRGERVGVRRKSASSDNENASIVAL